jgi:predicted ATPase/transcriptional regulator with XRE-family HTH domain
MDDAVSFGRWVMSRRQALDLTRDDVAALVGCAPVTVAKIERDERRPSHQMAERLADALRFPPEWREEFVRRARGVDPNVEVAEKSVTPEAAPAAPIVAATRGDLPVSPTSFVGREDDVEAVRSLLQRADVRLLTITGPAGIGKTRLSLQVVAGVEADFANGVWFVNLAPVRDLEAVIPAIAVSLHVREVAGRPLLVSLKDYLGSKQILLLLDNFEQIIHAAPLLTDLLASAPHLKVVVTSREPLRLYGEHQYTLRSLQLPDMEAGEGAASMSSLERTESVELFVQRARSVKPTFVLSPENAGAVMSICRRLDGLPLAIELAAARLRLFTPQAMLARLDDAVGENGSRGRLALLTGGARDLPARQQTLRNAIQWSYELLNEGERRLFRQMCVFNGGRSVEAVKIVCEFGDDAEEMDVLDSMASLVEKSLLRQAEGARAKNGRGEPRFWMLDTLREFAHEMLRAQGSDEANKLYERHAAYFLSFAEEAEPELRGPRQVLWLDRLEEEHANIRAALAYLCASSRSEEALRLAGAVGHFWLTRGHWSEGRAWLAKAQALPGGSAQVRAKALLLTGRLAAKQGHLEEALPLFREAESNYKAVGDEEGLASTLCAIGRILRDTGDYAGALAALDESLALCHATGARLVLVDVLRAMSNLAHYQGRYSEAREQGEQALAITREVGDKLGTTATLLDLAWIAHRQGDYDKAAEFTQEAMALSKELRERDEWSAGLNISALIAQEQGDYDKATRLLEEFLHIAEDLGSKPSLAVAMNNLGYLALSLGDYDRAETLLTGSLRLMNELGDMTRGISSRINLGSVALRRGEYGKAEGLFSEGLELALERGSMRYIAECMEGLAEAITHGGHGEEAARLFGFAAKVREEIVEPLRSFEMPVYERALALARSTVGESAFTTAWEAGHAMTLEDATSYWHTLASPPTIAE